MKLGWREPNSPSAVVKGGKEGGWVIEVGRVAGRERGGAGGGLRSAGTECAIAGAGFHMELQEIRAVPSLFFPLPGLFAAPIWG